LLRDRGNTLPAGTLTVEVNGGIERGPMTIGALCASMQKPKQEMEV
jgi:hypothetical protein